MFEKTKRKCVSIERGRFGVVGSKANKLVNASNTGACIEARRPAGTNSDPLRAFESHRDQTRNLNLTNADDDGDGPAEVDGYIGSFTSFKTAYQVPPDACRRSTPGYQKGTPSFPPLSLVSHPTPLAHIWCL